MTSQHLYTYNNYKARGFRSKEINKNMLMEHVETNTSHNRSVSPRGQQQANPQVFAHLLTEVCEYFNVDKTHIISKVIRTKDAAIPRHFTVWFLREKLRWKWQDIELVFGGKSRSALINSYEQCEKLIVEFPELKQLSNKLNKTV